MKRFGLKGKSVRIEVILVIVVLLLVLCMGFGYCLRFTRREGEGFDPSSKLVIGTKTERYGDLSIDVHPDTV